SEYHHSSAVQQPISHDVTGSICVAADRNSAAGNHIKSVTHERLEEHRRCRRFIRVVAVYQEIDVRLNISEHASNNVAFAPPQFSADNGACGVSNLSRFVIWIVVVPVHVGSRGRHLQIANDYSNRRFILVAWDDAAYTPIKTP